MVNASKTQMGRRFALVCPNYYPRTCGVGDHSMRVAQELIRRRFEVAIFTRGPAESNPEAPEVRVVSAQGPTPLLIANQLRRKIEAFAPTDLILQYTPQMFGAWRWGSPATLWLAEQARRSGINVVLLAHELFIPWSKRPDLTLGAALMRAQFAALMKLSHHVVVTMDVRARELGRMAKTFGLRPPDGVVRVGSNALPIERASRTSTFRIGMFSTLASSKRFDVVLDCFRSVQRRRPQSELLILGDLGDPRSRRVRMLHDAIDKHPARAQIRRLGSQSLSEIAREVATLDVYLFPMNSGANTRSGTLPLALGTGLPTVAVRGHETDSLFVDRENIMFADDLTGDSFAEAVFRLSEDGNLAERLSAGAKALYRAHFSWDKVVNQLLALI